MTRWLNNILSVAILVLLPVGVHADIGYKTGKIKVHQDRCYREYHWDKKGLVWEEFNCVNFMEHSSFEEEILHMLKVYDDNLRNKALSKEQYLELVQKTIMAWELSWGSNPDYKQIIENLLKDEEKILGRPRIYIK